MDKKKKIALFLEYKKKAEKRLEEIEKKFKVEKENEEAWPGHENIFLVRLEQEYRVTRANLEKLDKRLKKLGYDPQVN